MASHHVKAVFSQAAVEGILVSPGVSGLQKICEDLEVQECNEDNITAFLTSENMALTANVPEKKFYALLSHLGYEFDSSEEENKEDVLNAIMLQIERKDEVEVKPEQVLHKELIEDAIEVRHLTETMEIERATIQANQDECFAKFILTNPCDADTSMAVKRAQFSRDTYYFNTRCLLFKQMLTTRTMPRNMFLGKFFPLVSVCTREGLVSKENQELVKLVTATDLPIFENIFFAKWDTLTANVLKYATETARIAMFTEYVQSEYFPLLQEAVTQRQSKFTPKFPVEIGDATTEVAKQRRDWVLSLTSESAELVTKEVLRRWGCLLSECSSYLRASMDTAKSFAIFEEDNYYQCVEAISLSECNTSKWVYKPQVKAETDIEKSWVAKVTQESAKTIEHSLHQKWITEVSKMPSRLQSTLPIEAPVEFVKDVLFDTIRDVVETIPSEADSSKTKVVTSSSVVDITQQFNRRSTATDPQVLPSSTLEAQFIGAMDVLKMTLPSEGIFKFEGYLISTQLKLRSIANPQSPSKRPAQGKASQEKGDTKVLDVMAVDKSGPIQVSLWGDVAETMVRLTEEYVRNMGPQCHKKPLVLFENVRIMRTVANNFNGNSLTNMNYLQSVRGPHGQVHAPTKVTLLPTPTSAFLVSATFVIPSSEVVVTNFVSFLEGVQAPYRVSVKGIVTDIAESGTYSLQGNPKRAFKLVDEYGFWVNCTIVGEQAYSDELVDSAEIIIFFASARAATASAEGALFGFDNACMMAFGSAKSRHILERQVKIG